MYSQIQTYKFCTHTHILPEQAQNAKYENNFLLENTEIYVGCWNWKNVYLRSTVQGLEKCFYG